MPEAVALIFVVVGVTVVVNVAPLPRAVSVVGLSYPVTTVAVPSAPTSVPDAVAFILVVVGVTVVVNVASLPKTLSVVCVPKDTEEAAFVNVVASPNTWSPSPFDSVTLSLYASSPKPDKSTSCEPSFSHALFATTYSSYLFVPVPDFTR